MRTLKKTSKKKKRSAIARSIRQCKTDIKLLVYRRVNVLMSITKQLWQNLNFSVNVETTLFGFGAVLRIHNKSTDCVFHLAIEALQTTRKTLIVLQLCPPEFSAVKVKTVCSKLSLLSLTGNRPLSFSYALIFKKRKELPRSLFDILKTWVTIWRRAGYIYQSRKLNIFLSFVFSLLFFTHFQ